MTNKTNNLGGFLVVRRINWQTDIPIDDPIFLPDLKAPALSLSHEDVRNRYRGFDGWPWPDRPNLQMPRLIEGLASPNVLPVVEQYYEEISQSYICDLIYLDLNGSTKPEFCVPEGFVLLGYDYGYYVSEDNYFSSLIHEVIYGAYGEMNRYAQSLNNHLLLPSHDLANLLDESRNELLKAGADLETDGEILGAIAVYGTLPA